MRTPTTLRARRLLDSRHPGQFGRFSVASVVAAGTSHVTFLVVYAVGATATVASVLGFLAGVAPNYLLSRRWAFGRKGRSDALREVLPYAAMVVGSLLATVLGTTLAERWLVTLGLPRQVEVVAVTLAFAAVNGVLFVGKYVVMDRWLFGPRTTAGQRAGVADRDRDERSRHQVPTSTRP